MSDPIEDAYRERMRDLARILDDSLNGNRRPRKHGFVVFMFRMGESRGGRMNYISNAARDDMLCALKEFIANVEGRAMPSVHT